MNPITLWVRKDAHRFLPWVAAWLVVLALRATVALDVVQISFFRTAVGNLTWLVTPILFILLVTLIVHEDPPTDPKAFWPTRAVSSRQLVAAKCVFVGLVLVLPGVGVEILEIATTGVDRRIVTLAAAEVLLDWVAWGAVVMLLAALTASLPGFIGASAATFLLVPATQAVLAAGASLLALQTGEQTWWTTLLAETMRAFFNVGFRASIEASRTLAVTSIVVVVALLVTTWTYVGRRRNASWAIVAGSVVGLTLLWMSWRWDLVPTTEASQPVAVAAPNVKITLEPIGRRSVAHYVDAGTADTETTVDANFSVTGAEPPKAVEIRRLSGSLVYPDGGRYAVTDDEDEFTASWDLRVVEGLLAGARIVNHDAAAMRPLLQMPVDDFERRRTQHGRIEVTATAAVRHYDVAAEMPLKSGALVQRGEEQVVIREVMLHDGDCTVQAVGARTSLLLAPGRSTIRSSAFIRYDPDTLYVLRNKRRGEALVPDGLVPFGFGWVSPSRLDRVHWILSFRGTPPRQSRSVLDEDWLRDADLVRVEATTAAEVERHVSVQHFAIDPEAGPPPVFEVPPQARRDVPGPGIGEVP